MNKKNVIIIVLIVLFIALVVTLGVMYLNKNTVVTLQSDDIYVFEGTKLVQVLKCQEHMEIPKGVTQIECNAFGKDENGSDKVTSIIIPDSVTLIEKSAFSQCQNVVDIQIPKSVTNFSVLAFPDNWINKQFTGKENENLIINNILLKANNVNSKYVLPEGILEIGDFAFYDCKSLKSIVVPQSVIKIGANAFEWCINLESVTLSEGITKIDSYAFANTNLFSVVLPDTITELGGCSFSNCANLGSIVLPSKITEIDQYTFSGCHNLQNVEIPQSVIKIGADAFNRCINLESVTLSEGITKIDSYAFANTNLSSIVLPDTITELGESSFSDCVNLESIVLPSKITEIDQSTFSRCYNLQNVEIPQGVTQIGKYAFNNTNLKDVILPNNLMKIDAYAFLNTKIENISIPQSVNKVGIDAFKNTKYLQNEFRKNKALIINNILVKVDPTVTKYNIPNEVIEILPLAFENCSQIKEIVIPSTIKQIQYSVFNGCTKLDTITIPSSVTEIESAFEDCQSLKTLNIAGVPNIQEAVFYRCYNLTNINVSQEFWEKYQASIFSSTIWYKSYVNNLDKNIKPKVYDVPLREYVKKVENNNNYFPWLFNISDDLKLTQEEIDLFNSIPQEWMRLLYGQDPFGALVNAKEYKATSSLKENNTIHSPNNLTFNSLDKFWVEGVTGFGIGEKITVNRGCFAEIWLNSYEKTINEMCKSAVESLGENSKGACFLLTKIYIENGYCESKELWEKNARVKTLKLTLNNEIEYILNLEDTMNVQMFEVEYATKGIDKPLNAVFEILDVYEGTTYQDTALTTLELMCSAEGASMGR